MSNSPPSGRVGGPEFQLTDALTGENYNLYVDLGTPSQGAEKCWLLSAEPPLVNAIEDLSGL